jgi:dihydroxyacetone kinase
VSYICKAVKHTSGERIALMVNNLGSTTNIELYIVANAAISELEKRGFVIERIYIGPFMTALEMPGFSLSVLKVDDNLIKYLDMPTISPAWPSKSEKPSQKKKIEAPQLKTPTEHIEQETGLSKPLEDVITLCAKKAIDNEQFLTEIDSICGDGGNLRSNTDRLDMGINLARGAKQVLSQLPTMKLSSVSATLYDISMIVQGMGG